jgi:recombination protein RecT
MHDPDQVPQDDKNQSSLLDQKQSDNKAVVKKSEDDRPTDDQAQSAVATQNKRTLTTAQLAIVRMQSDVMKFVAKMLGTEKAQEYATRVALIARDNPKLGYAIQKNPESFLTAFMASAERDLMPNTSKGLAYLIPYGEKVQFQVGYSGLLLEARRTGEVMTIDAELVFEGDEFEVTFGTDRRIIHKPSFDVDRTNYNKVTHVYATAKLTNGEHPFMVMTKKELDKIRTSAKASSTDAPWHTWPERMAIKTVYKRLSKVLPSERMQRAAELDSLAEAGKLKFDREKGEFIEGELADISSETRDAIDQASTPEELQSILGSLPASERRKAASLVAEKMKTLQ